MYALPPARNWSSTAGYFACVAPIDCHAPLPFPSFSSEVKVAIEFWVASTGTEEAGYARSASCCASHVPLGPSFATPALSPAASGSPLAATRPVPLASECDFATSPAVSVNARAATATTPTTTQVRLLIRAPLWFLVRFAGPQINAAASPRADIELEMIGYGAVGVKSERRPLSVRTPAAAYPRPAKDQRRRAAAAALRVVDVVTYGNVSWYAPRPCVAASSCRAPGLIVRPATVTIGRPGAACVHPFAGFASVSFATPKSVAA